MKNKKNYVHKKLYDLPLELIKPDPNNPRKVVDEEDLAELVNSVNKIGVKYPIIFREDGDDLVIVDGERRYRAAQKAELKTISGILDSGDPTETAIIANIHRREYTPVAEAEAFKSLKEKHLYTDENLSGILGRARTTISDILLINNLSEKIKKACRGSYDYPQRQLIKIARIKSPTKQEIAFKTLQEAMTVNKERTRTKKPEATARSIKSLNERLEKMMGEWEQTEKWGKREKATVKRELAALKVKIEDILNKE